MNFYNAKNLKDLSLQSHRAILGSVDTWELKMNLIEVYNAHSKIIPQSSVILGIAEDILSYAPAGATFAMKHTGGWDGRTKLMNRKGEFPTGLIPHLANEFKRRRIPYKFKDCRVKPEKKYDLKITGFPPRPYQSACSEMSDERPANPLLPSFLLLSPLPIRRPSNKADSALWLFAALA